MKFSEFPYRRPDFNRLKLEILSLLDKFSQAASLTVQNEVIHAVNHLRNEFEAMSKLAGVRHTLDTTDLFYKAEQDYYDEAEPHYQEIIHQYYGALVSSPYQQELAQRWGAQLFNIARMTLKTFSVAVIEDLQQENKLASRYKQLLASANIIFAGQERNLAQMIPFQMSTDRQIRKSAHEARYTFFSDHLEEFDGVFDELVKLRTEIARKLGFESFTELGYLRMNRSDYDAGMVASLRAEIENYVVPLASQLREKQRIRLGLDNLVYYDELLFFPDGNAAPQGTPAEILSGGRKLYQELSEETGTFFREMTDRGLLDVVSRKGKAAGGYCDYFEKFKAPFIFANFNGTSGDIDVLTHEAGHAFQVWLGRDKNVPEYYFATMEAAEIPSMGMEFFAWPWMELFFEDADKYRYSHMTESALFLPYGSLGDEFQHQVYANPGLSPSQRRQLWRRLEKKYLPHRDYADNDFLESGGFWFQQGHIFEVPFYYIDYVLAQVSVFQLWRKIGNDSKGAWADYLALCHQGGSLPFTELIKTANLISPLDAGCVASVIRDVSAWFHDVDGDKGQFCPGGNNEKEESE